MVNLHQDHSLKENLTQEQLMIQSIDLDTSYLHQVVVQMRDLQVTDLFYRNLILRLDQQTLKFKHILVQEHLIMKTSKETLGLSLMLTGHRT